jgi:hypothetical protein
MCAVAVVLAFVGLAYMLVKCIKKVPAFFKPVRVLLM